MSILQDIYDAIKNAKTPSWLKEVNKIIKSILMTLSRDLWSTLTMLIVEASKKELSPEQKFEWVYNQFRERWGGDYIKTSILNLLIEVAVAYLKTKTVIS